jgi:VacB/RNase II family 3'-5' exoribonuclease
MNADTGHPMGHREELRAIARRAMVERGLLPEFSAAALAETAAATAATGAGAKGVKDLRDRLWCSIDNDDSRDLDQLSVAEKLEDGSVKILIAVADVDAAVRSGSAVDAHARNNTTSVYTAAEIFPMLPERFSTDLTSLNPDQDRVAIVTEMVVAPDGVVKSSEIGRASVRNRAKLAYDSVAAWLDGRGPAPAPLAKVKGLDAQLKLQDRVAQSMKALRHQQGALTLDTAEAHAVFSGDLLSGLAVDERNRAKELIEDFMIAANGAIARFLEQKKLPAIRRILKTPERWPRIVALAAELKEKLPAEPNAKALEQFLAKRARADPESFPDLSLAVVKLLGRGEYVVERPGKPTPGHFGLAVKRYSHSTAPNRRYPDLLTQRLIKAALANRPQPYPLDELMGLARHCTDQEDNAARVERQVLKSAAALLLAARVGERFDAIVTGASEKGTFVRLLTVAVEGKVVRGFERLDVGDHVSVKLVNVNVERGYIDFVR